MDISSSAASAAALSQTRSRQDFTMSAMKQDAQAQASLTGELEKAAKGGNTTETRGKNVNITA